MHTEGLGLESKLMKRTHNYVLGLAAIFPLCLFGCATAYKPGGSGDGYSEMEMAADKFRIHFDGNANTPTERSRDFALLRAADVTLEHGFAYFVAVNTTPPVVSPSAPSGPNVEINNYSYGNNYEYHAGMEWNDPNAASSQNASQGLANLATFLAVQQQARQLAQTDLFIRCFEVKPPSVDVFDAQAVENSLRKRYGLKARDFRNQEAPESQNGAMSGNYLGSGLSVANGVEQPYQIGLAVFDSGRIAFACSAFVNGHASVVVGKGTVDSSGEVTIQSEFGDTGHGTISGDVVKAGGESPNGSIKSNFTAQKQK